MPLDQQEQIRLHLDTCLCCQQVLDSLSATDHTLPAEAPLVSGDEPACVAAIERLLRQRGDVRADPDASDETPAERDVPLDFLQPSRQAGSIGRLDHYEVIEVIGSGGMGIVLQAFDEKLRRVVAIKVMAPEFATSGSARKRFVREARAAAAIRNEHVINIHAVEDAGRLPYLVMEYIAGVSLEDRIKRSGPLKPHEVLRIGMQTAAGLAAAHAQGLVHRDIKPANILLENGVERVKITDFGLARAVDDASLTQSGVLTGTPQYMSPEQARGEPVDHRSDLFSLGSVLYAMCTGRPPFRADSTVGVLKRVADDTPRSVREVNAEISDGLAALIAKLLAKDPGKRFQTAAEVAALLGQQLAQLQQPSPASVPPRPKSSHQRQRRWLVAAIVFVAGLGLAGYQFGPAVYRFVTNQGVADVATGNRNVEGVVPNRPAVAAFTALAQDGKPERSFATLAEAVAVAVSGDTIEIRGDGPFVCPPLNLGNKALTIRAATGSWPVFQLNATAAKAKESLLLTDAPLVIEGLEFHCPERANAEPDRYLRLILARAPLHVANCRFVVKGDNADVIVLANRSVTCEVRNCQFVGAIHDCLGWWSLAAGRLVIDNSLAVGPSHGFSFADRESDLRDVSLHVTNNTLVTHRPIHFALDEGVPDRPVDRTAPVARLNATGNILDGGDAVFGFGVEKERQPLQATEAQALLGRLLSWREQGNLHAEEVPFLILGSDTLPPTVTLKNRSDWEAFWGLNETDSLQGSIRYQGGDLRAKRASTPDQVTPADFRLHPESAGFRAGADGRDPGADVNLVGPGPAYERWQQTPAYRQWRDESGQGSLHIRD